jgi:hypothetical protein
VPRTDAKKAKPVKVDGGNDDVGQVNGEDADVVVNGIDGDNGNNGDHGDEKDSSGQAGNSAVSTKTDPAKKKQKTQKAQALQDLFVPLDPRSRLGRSSANKVSGNGTPEKADEPATFVVRQPAKRKSTAAKPANVKPPGKTPAKSTPKTPAMQQPVQATVIVAPVTATSVSAAPMQPLKVAGRAAVMASTEAREEFHDDQDRSLKYFSNVGDTLLNFAERCNKRYLKFFFIYFSNCCCIFICMLVL